MDFKIAVLAGDGIGPEISAVGVDVMTAVCEKFGHKVSYEYAVCGADAIDKVGDPFPEATYQACKNADAVLFSAVGDPKFDNDPTAKVRPEQGLLAMRKKLGLFANIRPVQTFKCLLHKSPLRAELVDGADFLCIRELTGGMYFGEKYQDNDKAYDTNMLCFLLMLQNHLSHKIYVVQKILNLYFLNLYLFFQLLVYNQHGKNNLDILLLF